LFTPTLLAVAVRAANWNPNVAIVMIVCNVLAIAFAKYTIQKPNEGPAMPSANFFGDLSAGASIGALCFGHLIGGGTILGLTSMGVL
jgi:photosystem I subunit 10